MQETRACLMVSQSTSEPHPPNKLTGTLVRELPMHARTHAHTHLHMLEQLGRSDIPIFVHVSLILSLVNGSYRVTGATAY